MSTDEPLSAEGWVGALAQRLGVEAPTQSEIDQLLALAGIAAHASERQAAPISTWLTARAGLSSAAGLEAVRALAAELTAPPAG